jgi:AcrR family transcriptional regulator
MDTAESLFATRGYETTTMDDIAGAAGVTRAVVYAHFSNKEEILIAGIRRAHEELDARLGQLAEQATDLPPDEVIERGGELFFELLESAPSRWALLYAPSVASPSSRLGEMNEFRHETILRIIDVGVRMRPNVDVQQVEALAYMISGLGEQLGRWWLTQPSVPRRVVVGYYRDFIMRGISDLIV